VRGRGLLRFRRTRRYARERILLKFAVPANTSAGGRELSVPEQSHAEHLCKIVGGHPLALELVAARIKEGRPWTDLLDNLSNEITRLGAMERRDSGLIANRNGGEKRKKQESVRASLLLSVRYLEPLGQRLCARLGLVAEDAIITPQMAATLWSAEEETAREQLRGLSGLGLLRAEGDGYGIHDLMHDLARELVTAPKSPARAGDVPGLGLTLQDAHRHSSKAIGQRQRMAFGTRCLTTATFMIISFAISSKLVGIASWKDCFGRGGQTVIAAGIRFASVWGRLLAFLGTSAEYGATRIAWATPMLRMRRFGHKQLSYSFTAP
jgi:hypothetical protein